MNSAGSIFKQVNIPAESLFFGHGRDALHPKEDRYLAFMHHSIFGMRRAISKMYDESIKIFHVVECQLHQFWILYKSFIIRKCNGACLIHIEKLCHFLSFTGLRNSPNRINVNRKVCL